MARYQVILAFDGADFQGFQKQAQARTVQAVVESALRMLNWQGRAVKAAGRTDAGVHATGQVIAFDLDWGHSPGDLQRAINAHLPGDVAVREIKVAADDFHPRYDAISRRYRYLIFCDPVRDPLRERYAWRVWPPVDPGLLQRAAGFLPGTHDFSAFGAPPKPGGKTARTVEKAEWRQDERLLSFEIVCESFLYHMVRRLVSLQVEIGQGRLEVELILHYLRGQAASPVQGLAPAHGLFLKEVCYPEH